MLTDFERNTITLMFRLKYQPHETTTEVYIQNMETEQSALSQPPVHEAHPQHHLEQRRERTEMPLDGIIYVGKKGVMSYVWAVVTQFNNGAKDVHMKARGRSISKAVDVSQIVKNRFIPGLVFKQINLTTEELQSEDGSMSKVSSMEIVMDRPPGSPMTTPQPRQFKPEAETEEAEETEELPL